MENEETIYKIGDKLEYLIKTLSRTKRKDYENYIVNRVYNELDDLDIKPVTQKYVKNKKDNGKYYLIDLYFPQFNIGIECDEPYHNKQKEKDEMRTYEIISKMEGYKQRRISVKDKSIEEINKEIDKYVKEIKEEKKKQLNKGNFEPWKIYTAKEYFKNKNILTVNDDYEFSTISEACNIILNTKYKTLQRGYFKAKNKEGYYMWFPHLAGKSVNCNGWINTLSEDGTIIEEYNEKPEKLKNYQNNLSRYESRGEQFLNKKRIVLMKGKNEITNKNAYKFVGIFEMEKNNKGRITYKRISDKIELIK